MSPKDAEYLAHAAEAERLAQHSQSEEERGAYERIAGVWRDLAAAELGSGAAAPGEVSREQPAEATPQRAAAKSQ